MKCGEKMCRDYIRKIDGKETKERNRKRDTLDEGVTIEAHKCLQMHRLTMAMILILLIMAIAFR